MKHNLARGAPDDASPDEFEVESSPEPTPARRGRKRKADESKDTNSTANAKNASAAAKTNDVVVANAEEPAKRRRGRPRKSETVATTVDEAGAGEDAEGEDDDDATAAATSTPREPRKPRDKNKWVEEPRRSSARLKQIAQESPPAPPPAPVEAPKKKEEPARAVQKKNAEDKPKPTPPAALPAPEVKTPVSAGNKRGRKPNSAKMAAMQSTITPLNHKSRGRQSDGHTPTTMHRAKPGRDFPTFTWKVNTDYSNHEHGQPVIASELRNDLESRTFKWRINEHMPAPTPQPAPLSRVVLHTMGGATTTKPKSSTEHLPLFCFPENPPNARLIVLGCHPTCQAMLQPALELKARQVLDHFPEAVTMKEPLRVWYNGGYFLDHIPAETVCAELRKLHAGKPNNMVFSIAKGGYVVSFDDLTEEEVRGGMAWVGQGPTSKRVKVTLGFPMGFEHLQQAASAASGAQLTV